MSRRVRSRTLTPLAWVAVPLMAAVVTGCGGSRRTTAEFAALYGVGGSPVSAGAGAATQQNDEAGGGGVATVPGAGSAATVPGTGSTPGGAPTGTQAAGPGAASGAARAGGQAGVGGAGQAAGVPVAGSSPIVLGSVGVFSGPIGGALAQGVTAIQAWSAAVNAAGGINGHPIRLMVADDGGDPAKHLALVRQMVEQQHAVAFLHNIDPFEGQAAVPYLEQHHIPVVGTSSGSPWFNTSPMYFPQMPNDTFLSDTFAGEMATVGGPQHLGKIALIYCAEAQGCANATRPDAFQKAGLNVVYSAKASVGQPDYTAQCLSARNAGAEMVFMALDGQSVQRFADDCNTVGFKPVFGHVAPATTTAELSRPSMEGTVVGSPTAPWFQTSIPAVAEFQQTLAKYAPGTDPGGSGIEGWASAKLMEAALRGTPDPTTSSGILQGLYSIRNNDLGGLTYPISFRQGAPNNAESERGCWWVVRVQGGRFVSPDNGQRHCAAG